MNVNTKIIQDQKKLEIRRKRKRIFVIIISIILVILSVFYGMTTGSVSLTLSEIWEGLTTDEPSLQYQIAWNLRLPRILTGLLVGMSLAISGALLQGVTRNPLADPGIIGISAGAGLFAIITMVLFPEHAWLLPIGAFLGALMAAVIVYFLAWNRGASPLRLILAGVAVNTMLGAFTSGIMLLFSNNAQAVLPWLMGGLSDRVWPHFWTIFPYAMVGLIVAIFAAKSANVLLLGDEAAKLLGHNVERSRLFLILISALLAGAAVSVAGLIAFVGLIIPHTVRLLVGDNYYYILPISALSGAWLLVFLDTAARSWFNPIEVPVGILLAAIGGPFFLFLLRRGNVSH